MSSSTPPRYFRAFRTAAEDAPNRDDVFPVICVPSGSSIATQGVWDSSAFLRAVGTQGRSWGEIPVLFIRSSSFERADLCVFPLA